MQRPFPSRLFARGFVELELKQSCEEIARVGRVAGNMVLRTWIEIGFVAHPGGCNPLILQAQVGPPFVVGCRRQLAGKDLPAPFVDQQAKWQERHLVHRLTQKQPNVLVRTRHLVRAQQPDLHEILRRDAQGDSIADRFMKAVIRTILIQDCLCLVGTLIIIMPQLVMHRHKVTAVDLGAHLDAQIILRIEVPRTGMAYDVAVERFDELCALPERLGQRVKAKRGEKPLADLEDFLLPFAALGGVGFLGIGFDKTLGL